MGCFFGGKPAQIQTWKHVCDGGGRTQGTGTLVSSKLDALGTLGISLVRHTDSLGERDKFAVMTILSSFFPPVPPESCRNGCFH